MIGRTLIGGVLTEHVACQGEAGIVDRADSDTCLPLRLAVALKKVYTTELADDPHHVRKIASGIVEVVGVVGNGFRLPRTGLGQVSRGIHRSTDILPGDEGLDTASVGLISV
jgi:hypothetical protein